MFLRRRAVAFTTANSASCRPHGDVSLFRNRWNKLLPTFVNTARAKIVDRDAVVAALESGQLAGYAGDVWFPQPPPEDHPWRTMPHEGMTPHISGSSLSAQARYSAGTREILECYFEGRPIRDEYLIVQGGGLAGVGAKSYTQGNATGGSGTSRPKA